MTSEPSRIYELDEWLDEEGFQYEPKCRECGGEPVPPWKVSELPNPDGSATSAAYVEQFCPNGHLVKSFIMGWRLLERLLEMEKEE